jgi:hypothetical protein
MLNPSLLKDLFPISNPEKYKIHLANWNGERQPLDVFSEDREEWRKWNCWRGEKDEFNRDYIFSIIDFYREPNTWLFGGIYKVINRTDKRRSHGYDVELTDQLSSIIGRAKLSFKRPGRAKSLRLENYLDQFELSEILKQPYNGEDFCGYENINHDFRILENMFKRGKQDWKAALENIKGVYLITDKSNGKKYVGSAYNGEGENANEGIWSRWSCYLSNGHGNHSNQLKKLIDKEGKDYARNNFVFSLLEYRPMKTDDKILLSREKYWKNVFLSCSEFGYNDK